MLESWWIVTALYWLFMLLLLLFLYTFWLLLSVFTLPVTAEGGVLGGRIGYGYRYTLGFVFSCPRTTVTFSASFCMFICLYYLNLCSWNICRPPMFWHIIELEVQGPPCLL